MIADDTGNMCWRFDASDCSMYFTARDRPPRDATLMWFSAGERPRFLAVSMWLGERQHLWSEWRAMAEAEGGKALARHLVSLLGPDSRFEEFVAAMLVVERERVPEVTVAAGLATRRLDILRHRFASLALRDSFMAWAEGGHSTEIAKALSLIGLLEGRRALARLLDVIAQAPPPHDEDLVDWSSWARH
jgi:hypothetical protein